MSDNKNSNSQADSSLLTDEEIFMNYYGDGTDPTREGQDVAEFIENCPVGLKRILQSQHAKSFLAGVESGKKEQQEKDRQEIKRLKAVNQGVIAGIKDVELVNQQAILEAEKKGARELAEWVKKNTGFVTSGMMDIFPKTFTNYNFIEEEKLQSKLKSLEAK